MPCSALSLLALKWLWRSFPTSFQLVRRAILQVLPRGSKKSAKSYRKFDFMAEFLHHFAPREYQELLAKLVPVSKAFLINRDTKLEVIATEFNQEYEAGGFRRWHLDHGGWPGLEFRYPTAGCS